MSERSDRPDEQDLWVVEVTAPLASGRVREVAADAAARLKLPIEKLVVLLENRIGPITKPLPQASAARVAEVLDLSGAEVALRPADVGAEVPAPHETSDDQPTAAASTPVRGAPAEPSAEPPAEPAPEPAPESAPEPPAETPPVSPRVPPATSTVDEAAPYEAASPAAPAPAAQTESEVGTSDEDDAPPPSDAVPEDHASDESPAAAGAPKVLGRAGRGVDPDHAPDPPRTVRRDVWASLDHERDDEDEAMLGRWTPVVGHEPWSAMPPTPSSPTPSAPPSTSRDEPTPARPDAAPPASPADRPAVVVRRSATARRDDDEDEDDASWTYGLRDPFAEAEARERRLRRWTLMIALLVASTIFVVLQWAYSRPGLADVEPPPFAEGLAAYREGAFVSAARAWTPRAEAGDAEAMFLLGWMAEFGQGRPWSNREAASWYRQAAERGHPRAQARLADLYQAGLGVEHDDEAALRWYLAAAEGGVARAQREAALALARRGRSDEARAWLERAAAADDPVALAWWSLEAEGAATTVSP